LKIGARGQDGYGLLHFIVGIFYRDWVYLFLHFHSHSHFSSPFCKLTAERVGFIFSHYQIGGFFFSYHSWAGMGGRTDGGGWGTIGKLGMDSREGLFFFLFLLLLFTSKGKESSSFSFIIYSLLGISGPFLAFIGILGNSRVFYSLFYPILFFYLPFSYSYGLSLRFSLLFEGFSFYLFTDQHYFTRNYSLPL